MENPVGTRPPKTPSKTFLKAFVTAPAPALAPRSSLRRHLRWLRSHGPRRRSRHRRLAGYGSGASPVREVRGHSLLFAKPGIASRIFSISAVYQALPRCASLPCAGSSRSMLATSCDRRACVEETMNLVSGGRNRSPPAGARRLTWTRKTPSRLYNPPFGIDRKLVIVTTRAHEELLGREPARGRYSRRARPIGGVKRRDDFVRIACRPCDSSGAARPETPMRPSPWRRVPGIMSAATAIVTN